ncbi:MAG: VIT1/CCC1 transporter family protein [Aquiluna sp.]|nr:VIT1/CCC1 transporter family protein [Aquiluna sp.]
MAGIEEQRLELKLNWLRASVLGANDGIISVAGVVMGVAAAGADSKTILVAGIAALVAGAISMGGGEYVSVSSQRDAEISHGRQKSEISARPWAAAFSSFVAFTAGATLPLIAITGPWQDFGIQATIASVALALALTGWWAAWAGKTSILKSISRNVSMSALTMGISYGIGALLGVTVF